MLQENRISLLQKCKYWDTSDTHNSAYSKMLEVASKIVKRKWDSHLLQKNSDPLEANKHTLLLVAALCILGFLHKHRHL